MGSKKREAKFPPGGKAELFVVRRSGTGSITRPRHGRALKRYMAIKDDIEAGGRPEATGTTVADLRTPS